MKSPTPAVESPVRIGVFPDVASTQRAVAALLADGFTREQITVISSDEAKERHFREFEHQKPAGTNTPVAAVTGGSIGAAVGGVAGAAAGIAAGGIPFAVLGGAGMLTGGVLGGFLGAMMSRGFEKEAADFYNQSVTGGKLLVAVEMHGPAAESSLSRAELILAEAGAEPMPLVEG